MFDDLLVESPLYTGEFAGLPLPDEAPREPTIDRGTAPGPFALMMASTVDPARLSDAEMLDLIGLVDRSITVTQALRSNRSWCAAVPTTTAPPSSAAPTRW